MQRRKSRVVQYLVQNAGTTLNFPSTEPVSLKSVARRFSFETACFVKKIIGLFCLAYPERARHPEKISRTAVTTNTKHTGHEKKSGTLKKSRQQPSWMALIMPLWHPRRAIEALRCRATRFDYLVLQFQSGHYGGRTVLLPLCDIDLVGVSQRGRR